MSNPNWEKDTMEDIWALENAIRALRRSVEICNDYLKDAPGEPETAAVLQEKQACELAVKMMVERLGYDLRS